MDLSEYISILLFEHNEVPITDLGSFIKTETNANIDYIQGEVAPPSTQIQFSTVITGDEDILPRYIALKQKTTVEKGREILAQYVQELHERLDNNEFVKIPQVGRLYKNYDQQLNFLPSKANLSKASFGLPTIAAKPLDKQTEALVTLEKDYGLQPQKAHDTMSVFAAWINRNLVWVATVSFAVILAGIYFSVFHTGNSQPHITTIPDSDRTHVTANDITNEDDDIDMTMEDDELVIIDHDDDEVDTTATTPTINADDKHDAKISIIVIGKFANQKNIDNLLERIYNQGHTPYLDKEGKLTIVGIQLPYESEVEVIKILEKVRKDFAPDAEIIKL